MVSTPTYGFYTQVRFLHPSTVSTPKYGFYTQVRFLHPRMVSPPKYGFYTQVRFLHLSTVSTPTYGFPAQVRFLHPPWPTYGFYNQVRFLHPNTECRLLQNFSMFAYFIVLNKRTQNDQILFGMKKRKLKNWHASTTILSIVWRWLDFVHRLLT